MRTFTFQPSLSLDSSVLSRKSTCAKVCYQAQDCDGTGNLNEVFSDAKLYAPSTGSDRWSVVVDFVPGMVTAPSMKAVLYVTRGDLGKQLGSIELGTV